MRNICLLLILITTSALTSAFASDVSSPISQLPARSRLRVEVVKEFPIPAGDESTLAGWNFVNGVPQAQLTIAEKQGLHCRLLSHFLPTLAARITLQAGVPSAPYLVGESSLLPSASSMVSRTSLTFWKDSETENPSGRLIIDCQKPGLETVSIDELNQVFKEHLFFSLSPYLDPAEAESSATSPRPTLLRKLLPSFIVTQTGGYIGYVTLGTGWKIGDHVDISVQVGYVPKFAAGIELWQFSVKTEVHPFSHFKINIPAGKYPIQIDPAYIGLSMIYSGNSNLFLTLPARYPESGYYEETALRFAPYLGLEASWNHHHLFIEASVLDTELRWYILDRHEFKISDLKNVGVLGAGYKYKF